MIIVKIQGGLGNQMFQYALCCKLKHIFKTVKMDVSWYDHNKAESQRQLELKLFPVNLDVCSKWEKCIRYNAFTVFVSKHLGFNILIYRERTSGVYLPEIFERRNVYLDGYWQTEQYFKDIREQILQEFTFPEPITEKENTILELINATKSVSIHIRRGDYLKHSDKYGNICTKEYYREAIRCMNKNLGTPVFFVFSDDLKWCKDFLGIHENIYYVDLGKEVSEIHDMKLMSACKHNIIANSSFSWWASWLNQNANKIVIAPDRWQNGSLMPDIACKGWIRLGNKGE